MKRVVLAIKNGLISEAVTLALKRAGFAVEKAVTFFWRAKRCMPNFS